MSTEGALAKCAKVLFNAAYEGAIPAPCLWGQELTSPAPYVRRNTRSKALVDPSSDEVGHPPHLHSKRLATYLESKSTPVPN